MREISLIHKPENVRHSISSGRCITPFTFSAIAVFGAAAFILLYNLGGYYLRDWDEAWYVLMAEKALIKENYMVLEFRNTIFWDKSPFPVYPMILFFRLFGINEVTARLPSALFGLGLLAQIYAIASRFYGRREALLSILVTITSTLFIFWHGLKSADIESITLFFLVGSISCWLLFEKTSRRIIFSMLSLALAFLCKGPVIAVPVLVIISTFFVENPLKRTSLKPFLIGLFGACLIVLPWYAYMYMVFGNEFVEQHVVRNFLHRYTADILGSGGGDTFYLQDLLKPENFAWCGAAIISIIYTCKRFSEERRLIDYVMVSWTLVAFFVATQSQTKFFWYVFPIYPALAIMTARTLSDFIDKQTYLNKIAYYLGLIVILTFFFSHKIFPHSSSNVVKAGIVALLFFGIATLIEKRFPKYRMAFSVLLVCVLGCCPIYQSFKMTINRDEKAPALLLVDGLDLTKPIYAFQLNPSAIYYLSRKGRVYDFYNLEDIKQVTGQLVITRTVLLDQLTRDNTSEKLQIFVNKTPYSITRIKSINEFSLVKVETL